MSGGLLIAGGGTGGHLFPGLAVAQALRAMRPELEVAFVSTGKALESQVLAGAGFDLEAIAAKAFRGAGWLGRFKSLAALPGALLSARAIIQRRRPALVLAVGGYAAFSLGLMARLMGVPLLVQEQNALPGLTNRILSLLAARVFISFQEAAAHLPSGKTFLTGNPLRAELLAQAREAAGQRPEPGQQFRVLVLGGSQGAKSLNQALVEALPLLGSRRERLFFTHQTGQKDQAEVEAGYGRHGFAAQVAAFFPEMGRLYGLAHLVICRAGAGTLTEVMACGRAALCVPYPFAAGDHQTKNALALAQAGAGRHLPQRDLKPATLAALIAEFMDRPQLLSAMEERSQALGRPRAAQDIAHECLAMIKEAS
jgi:UDP-N-acetylglucosamine--N-acetylmuramyl-(pentapeptide) pyrophosphoryl-undecaprenol N-acetylglucosamine transferase